MAPDTAEMRPPRNGPRLRQRRPASSSGATGAGVGALMKPVASSARQRGNRMECGPPQSLYLVVWTSSEVARWQYGGLDGDGERPTIRGLISHAKAQTRQEQPGGVGARARLYGNE